VNDYRTRTTTPPSAVPLRMMRNIWRQRAHTPSCPSTPRLDGKLALVTGGNAGIGQEISRGLAKRGARVIIAARNVRTCTDAAQAIAAETGSAVDHVPLDLADLESVVRASARLEELTGGRPLDVLVANAGLWPKAYAKSPQGHEIAFATNTLGHHLLVRRLLDRGLLRATRIVMLTGDIYIRTNECTSDFSYEGASGGALAYSRSKLGNLWFTTELQKRHPELEVCAVHPGVIASGLGGEVSGFGAIVQGIMMLDVARGAETPLWCATQPIERGGYYHNTMGRLVLSASDPAASEREAGKLWARLEELSAPFC
jgi:NAD(P)-dependent dehydrogenase (short-subunit alcohol dehydrogenase family)